MALTAAACSSGSDVETTTTGPESTAVDSQPAEETEPITTDHDASQDTIEPTPNSSLPEEAPPLPEIEIDANVQPGVEQISLISAQPGTSYTVLDADGESEIIAEGIVDEYGSLVFRSLDSNADHRLATSAGVSQPIDVLARDEHPAPEFFAEQRLEVNRENNTGFDYIETRDGTTLGAYIVLPGPIEDGPYPTVVEYSGYSPSNPTQGAGFATLFSSLGYAYVGVNMRGTGCSGGSFRYFEYTQSTDGYDAVEAVAAQPWVAGNAVGMVGISYPGISQLFVAETQPPNLMAITPVSVNDDSYQGTLYPGGILNTGFAVNWTQERVDSALPSIDADGKGTGLGQGWSFDEIAAGDTTCAANQGVRLQNPDLVAEIRDNPFYDLDLGPDLTPREFVDRIEVPTFLAGAWQDEQTGGRFPTMIDEFTGTDHLYVSVLNGLHTESISPAVLPRLIEFLDLYVAERTPNLNVARALTPVLAIGLYGTDVVGEMLNRFEGMSFKEALAAFEAEPPIQILFEQGAADGEAPLTPLPRFTKSFESWPIPELEPQTWFLNAEGGMDDIASPLDDLSVSYLAVPDGVAPTFWTGNSSDLWRTDVVWDWQEPALGTFADFRSDPLTDTLTMVGSGSVDLWVNSNLGDTDLEVTLTELRPDGTEVMVQSGWLRASHRQLDEDASTPLRPVHTHLETDAEPLAMPGDDRGDPQYDLARVEIFPFAHVFRAGSQIRIMVDAPGGNRAVWEFESIVNGEQVTIGAGGTFASAVVLPVVPGIEPPADYPACDSLRGQPCRVPR
ncbi:MAG: putative acyl esterase [Candidatus Aldehydirespiratoraceae bacterium]|jgi:predicted acyl esterase